MQNRGGIFGVKMQKSEIFSRYIDISLFLPKVPEQWPSVFLSVSLTWHQFILLYLMITDSGVFCQIPTPSSSIFFLFIFNKILARCSEGGAQSNAVKAETPFPPSVSLLLVGFEIWTLDSVQERYWVLQGEVSISQVRHFSLIGYYDIENSSLHYAADYCWLFLYILEYIC